MKQTLQCLFSPRLYKIYRDGSRESMYEAKGFEKWGDKVISSAHMILNIGMYTSPFICMYIYQRGLYTLEESKGLLRVFGCLGCFVAAAYVLRAYGRACNPGYVRFLRALTTPGAEDNVHVDNIRKYDFEFHAWPVTYSVPLKQKSWYPENPFTKSANEDYACYQRWPIQLLAFIAVHTFGIRLIYPGSLSLVHMLLWNTLFQGRTQLVEVYNGKRAKVVSAEGNAIDTLFVDNRDNTTNGEYLVVCCEGNSGFYEIGIMTTPVKRGYSALGWNHPGFAGSTGKPYPEQEQNAIDAVMQYAINELGFQPNHIVLFGWSIGGYAAAWAAVNYSVYGLVLDATFDDLLPLAERQMPSSWRLLVREVVRTHVDLNVAALVTRYTGPIQIVRRTEDEIICLRQGVLATNRGNNLLMKLIDSRHHWMTTDVEPMAPLDKLVALLDHQRATLERSGINNEERNLLKLIGTYLSDYKSSHCVPLPEQMFENIMKKLSEQVTKKLK